MRAQVREPTAKDGVNTIATVAFGVPESATITILLSGFLFMGLVPSPLAEHYLYIAAGAFGASFFLRPLVVAMLLSAVGVVSYAKHL